MQLLGIYSVVFESVNYSCSTVSTSQLSGFSRMPNVQWQFSGSILGLAAFLRQSTNSCLIYLGSKLAVTPSQFHLICLSILLRTSTSYKIYMPSSRNSGRRGGGGVLFARNVGDFLHFKNVQYTFSLLAVFRSMLAACQQVYFNFESDISVAFVPYDDS